MPIELKITADSVGEMLALMQEWGMIAENIMGQATRAPQTMDEIFREEEERRNPTRVNEVPKEFAPEPEPEVIETTVTPPKKSHKKKVPAPVEEPVEAAEPDVMPGDTSPPAGILDEELAPEPSSKALLAEAANLLSEVYRGPQGKEIINGLLRKYGVVKFSDIRGAAEASALLADAKLAQVGLLNVATH